MGPLALLAFAPSLLPPRADDLQNVARTIKGRVGIAVGDARGLRTVNGDARFSIQSVTKLITAAAILDAVDRGRDRLGATVVVRRRDLSLNVQPLARLVGPHGYRTTVGDLVRRAVVDSDSAANDVLFARVGGAPEIRAFLARKDVRGVRVDRDERHLQTQTAGLDWRPSYVDARVLERAKVAVPPERRRAAYRRYAGDPRDTATPRGLADLLLRLASGRLLSPGSTRFLRRAMADCATAPDRLRAGVLPGWRLEHKTGSSGSLDGLTVATNDVGIAVGPDGRWTVIVALVADSPLDAPARDAAIARVARAVFAPPRG